MSVEPGSGDAILRRGRGQHRLPHPVGGAGDGRGGGPGDLPGHADAIEYGELEPATLKGKGEPVRIFHADGTKARHGRGPDRRPQATYVGRADELARAHQLFETTGGATPVRLVTVIGEAGWARAASSPSFARTWSRSATGDLAPGPLPPLRRGDHLLGPRRGREGAGRHPGVRLPRRGGGEADAVASAGADQNWMRERLLPLIGLESTSASRDESFTAWRRFLEGMAADHPAVVVIEDLHWADEAMLAFLEHVAAEPTPGRCSCSPRLARSSWHGSRTSRRACRTPTGWSCRH